MKKRVFSFIVLLLSLLLLSACYMASPDDGLPGRGDTSSLPENTINFGYYDGSAIQWYVLDNSGGNLLLVSQYVLNSRAYNSTDGVTWNESDMRVWLGSNFYNAAFSDAEKSVLLGSDKVTLLSRAQAENTAYFSTDAQRTATESGGSSNTIYWLMDDGGSAICITETGAIGSTNATVSFGVRPVITIDGSAIAQLIDTASMPASSGELNYIESPYSYNYRLAVWDDTLPTLTVSDYSVDDKGTLTIDCTTSSALGADEMVSIYLTSTTTGADDYVGYSTLTGGQLVFNDLPWNDTYDVQLAVMRTSSTTDTYAIGPVCTLSEPVHILNIYGIEEGGHYLTGQSLDFTAVGLGTSEAEPSIRWAPDSWSAGTQSGVWSDAPYTGSLVFDTPGDYVLTVTFRLEQYSGSGWTYLETDTRTVTFHVAQELSLAVSPGDGIIYTGGRVTITPNLTGGTWDFDGAYLSRDGNQFTGLKAGTTTVTYTVGAQSKSVTVTIRQSEIPSTGQDFTWVWGLCGAALMLFAAAGWLLRRRHQSINNDSEQ